MIKKFNRGFTLIELLVVIAIIGILSSVVLASLNTARGKGADAAIKSNLANIRAQAEIVYDSKGCYNDGVSANCNVVFPAGACAATPGTIFANTNVLAQITSAASAQGGGLAATRCSEDATDSTWAAAVLLKTSDGNAAANPDVWCVDSNGASKAYTFAAGQTIANAITANDCN